MPGKRTHSRLRVGGRFARESPMSSVRYLNRHAPGWVRVLLAGLALCGAGYAVLLVGGGTWVGLDPDSWWPVGALGVGAALACTARAVRGRHERDAWTLLAAAMASWAAGVIVWAALYEHQAAPPYPSIADALWIPFYLLMLGALASLVHAERPRVPPTAWLDALIPACAVSAVASQLLMPHVSTAGKPLAEQVALLAYPAL